MLFTTATGSKWKNRAKRAAGAMLTVVLLSAVAVVGISLLGSEVLAAWKTPGNAEQTFVSTGAVEGLLNFEAPAATVARFDAHAEQVAKAESQNFSDSVFVKNFKFTLTAAQQFALNLEFFISIETLLVQFNAYNFVLNNPTSPFVSFFNSFALTFTQTAQNLINSINRSIPGLPPPPIIPPYRPPSPTA